MHPCLLVAEVMGRIAEESTSPRSTGPQDDGLRTLYALARTCRAFLEPALDSLWYEQYTLMHAVKCLPGELWTRVPVDMWNGKEISELASAISIV